MHAPASAVPRWQRHGGHGAAGYHAAAAAAATPRHTGAVAAVPTLGLRLAVIGTVAAAATAATPTAGATAAVVGATIWMHGAALRRRVWAVAAAARARPGRPVVILHAHVRRAHVGEPGGLVELDGFVVQEAAAVPVRATALRPKGLAARRLVLGVPWCRPQLRGAVRKLALVAISTRARALESTTQLWGREVGRVTWHANIADRV